MITIYPWQTELWRKLAAGSPPAHALLLRGRKGLGKLAFATYLAKSRLCEHPSATGDACGNCPSCRWFDQGSHPDFRLVEPEAISKKPQRLESGEGNPDGGGDPKGAAVYENDSAMEETGAESSGAKSKKKPSKQIGVEQIRDQSDFINTSSHQNGYKIIVIHPAEAMNPSAANALLKNLEEPPARTLFILVTHHSQHLLPTIRSRCRQIGMPAPTPAAAIEWLKQQRVGDAETCLASAGFAPLGALEFNDDKYLQQHQAFIRQISTPENLDIIALADVMQKADLPTVVNWLQKWCYDLMSFRTAGKIRYHLDMLATVKSLASSIEPRSLATYSRRLAETHQLAGHTLNSRLFLEEMLLSYVKALSPARRA
ncbi:DNA polymerase III delta prime subunit [Nitrosospira sp. Nsp2]|uniref:DNA polymerase III subunit delta' n=1 Tax=Nitrosospira sp. Nsp2 TaxID=136548 RepID=UPI000D2F9CC1|nr:DNA polymerase III subunit delta' [Nitrosospira sp. Nsp2]PTR16360.1 DNA polymerase III delta prime subunit [Nitrosospira sp. Nsp2]